MRKILLTGLAVILSWMCQAQKLEDKASSSSSFIFKDGAVNYNISEKELSFGYNNLNSAYIDTNGFAWGLMLKGKNDNNSATIISKDNYSSEGKTEFFIGYFGVEKKKTNDYIFNLIIKEQEIESTQKNNRETYIRKTKELIKLLISKPNDTTKLIEVLNKEDLFFTRHVNLSDYDEKEKVESLLEKLVRDDKLMVDNLLLQEKLNAVRKEIKKYQTSKKRQPYIMEMIFCRMSAYGQSFKHYNTVDSSNFFNSFKSKSFTGFSVGVGYQYKFKNVDFTFSYNHILSNNFFALNKKTFKIHEEIFNSDSTQKLTKEKELTAYTGEYKIYNYQQINLDFLIYYPLKNTETVAVINPYFIGNVNYDHNIDLPNHFSVGVSTYLFKNDGSLIGGFYIESFDVTNQIEKQKENSELEPLYKRLKIGLSVSYKLDKLANHFFKK